MVTLYGDILRESDGRLLFRVAAGLGDAAALGFPEGGQFWVGRKQCYAVIEAQRRGERDCIRLGFELASLKAQYLVCEGC